MLKKITILFILLSFLSCDKKKTAISGKVVSITTGEPIFNALVNYIQCKSNGENCEEIVIAQVYTNQSGEFVINQKTASKSKTKWITVYKDNRKVGQKDNIGINDKGITIQVNL